jgi:hypothetical protein
MLSLQIYLGEVLERPFVFGEHDCLVFTNEACRRMHGRGWADDWIGRYATKSGAPLARRTLQSRFGHRTFVEAIDARLVRIRRAYPPRGALVATAEIAGAAAPFDIALGVANGERAAFLGPSGIVWRELAACSAAWDLSCPRQ